MCYCLQPDFGYGLRDCANEACSSEDAETTLSYATGFCSSMSAGDYASVF